MEAPPPCREALHAKGQCDNRFVAVREAFEHCFQNLGETGACVAVYHAGKLVCDLYGGTKGQGDWCAGTLVMPYSVSKPFAALCCLILVDRGLLCPDSPVARYWPEFAAEGKACCTVRQLLEHRSGFPFVPPGCDLVDLLGTDCIAKAVAACPPMWEPGEVLGEHCITYGHLCGELVRRISGMSLGAFFRAEVAEPLAVDLHFGLHPDRAGDCAELSAWPLATVQELRTLTPLAERGLFEPDVLCREEVVNSMAWRAAEIPAVNLHGTARDVAKVYACLAGGGEIDGVRLLKQSTVELLLKPTVGLQVDRVLGFEARWAMGFQQNDWEDGGRRFGDTFGLGGIGGSSAFGCCEGGGVGFAYLTRQMGNWDRANAVEKALLDVVLNLPATW